MLVGHFALLDSFVKQERSLAKGKTLEGINALPWPPKGWIDTTFLGDTRTDMTKPLQHPASVNELLNERATTHGHIEDNAFFTEEITNTFAKCPPKAMNSAWFLMNKTAQFCLWMIAHKIGRILSGNWREPDHWRDIAGYATLVADRLERGELQ